MFLVILTYVKPIEAVMDNLERHVEFLEKYYEQGKFIVSGPQKPREGGFILCKAADAAEVQALISEDPFHLEGVAEYKVIEFEPTKYAEGFEMFIG